MTHTRQMADSEGEFQQWKDAGRSCGHLIPASGLPCGHPVEFRVWESSCGGWEDYQYRCRGGGHTWWVEGIDS